MLDEILKDMFKVHDAKVRNAALEEAAQVVIAHGHVDMVSEIRAKKKEVK